MENYFELFKDIQEKVCSCRVELLKLISHLWGLDKINSEEVKPFSEEWKLLLAINSSLEAAQKEFLENGYSLHFESILNNLDKLVSIYFSLKESE